MKLKFKLMAFLSFFTLVVFFSGSAPAYAQDISGSASQKNMLGQLTEDDKKKFEIPFRQFK
tara:strand:- start:1361 stop:1543 length:183 start_codon:yes stop_codon:yes gene_type:complete